MQVTNILPYQTRQLLEENNKSNKLHTSHVGPMTFELSIYMPGNSMCGWNMN